MKPLIILLSAFLITLLVLFATDRCWNFLIAGNIGMSVMLLFTALGHFIFTAPMARMLPPSIRFRNEIVILTGLLEVLAAVGLVIAETRILASWFVIMFFVLILPANIYAASKKVNYMKATEEGPGLPYLWFRIPLQLFYIAWVVYFSIYLQINPL